MHSFSGRRARGGGALRAGRRAARRALGRRRATAGGRHDVAPAGRGPLRARARSGRARPGLPGGARGARRGRRGARDRRDLGRRRAARARCRGAAVGDDRSGCRGRTPAQPKRGRRLLGATTCRGTTNRRAGRYCSPGCPASSTCCRCGARGGARRPFGAGAADGHRPAGPGARRGRASHRSCRGRAVVAGVRDRRRHAPGHGARDPAEGADVRRGSRLGRGRSSPGAYGG